jgi:hypothetical protein
VTGETHDDDWTSNCRFHVSPTSLLLPPQSCSESLSSGGKVIKALRFYQLAQDWHRTNALLDRALWRCITALINVSAALTSYESSSTDPTGDADNRFFYLIPRHLRVLPVYPRGAVLTGESTLADYWDLRHYPESRSRHRVTPERHGRSRVGDTAALGESALRCPMVQSFLRPIAVMLDCWI